MNTNQIIITPMNNPRVERRFPTQTDSVRQTNQTNQSNQLSQRNNPFGRLPVQRPMPGKTEVYGAIIKSTVSNKWCLVKGANSGKWSLPKGHRNIIPGNPPIIEDPFACVVREVGEEIGIDRLPMPLREYPLRVGYYYVFEVPFELPLNPRDTQEICEAGWFTLQEMESMNLNIDASLFRKQMVARQS